MARRSADRRRPPVPVFHPHPRHHLASFEVKMWLDRHFDKNKAYKKGRRTSADRRRPRRRRTPPCGGGSRRWPGWPGPPPRSPLPTSRRRRRRRPAGRPGVAARAATHPCSGRRWRRRPTGRRRSSSLSSRSPCAALVDEAKQKMVKSRLEEGQKSDDSPHLP